MQLCFSYTISLITYLINLSYIQLLLYQIQLSKSVDNLDKLVYNPDIMKEYNILDFARIDFPFWVDRGMHTKAYSPHTHNFIELEIVLSGKADHIVEGTTYHIKRGDVLVIMPSYVHELRNVDHLEIYNYKFELDKLILLEEELEQLSGFQTLFILQPFDKYQHDYTSFMSLEEEKLAVVQTLSELILVEWNEKKAGFKLSIKSYLLTLITFLSRNFSPSLAGASAKVPQIIHTVNYIHENLTEKISLHDLAAIACLSERQYSRIFREVYGVSPIDYVIKCRLILASRLLKNTKLPLTEVSHRSGFGDKVSFSRVFTKKYGITPGKYRVYSNSSKE